MKCTQELHERIKRDTAAWRELPLVGVQRFPASGDEPAGALELRNHHCGSTLGREVRR